MNLYIQIQDGAPINHPALESNLLDAFNNNIPSTWEPFDRIEQPIIGLYQVLEKYTPDYLKVDGRWKDVWYLRDMTTVEKTAKQQAVKDAWLANANYSNFTSWTFSEDICNYEPPVPLPVDDKIYFWQGTTNSWVERPEYPTDGKTYTLDFATATWVLVTE